MEGWKAVSTHQGEVQVCDQYGPIAVVRGLRARTVAEAACKASRMPNIALVYQGGIANVFHVEKLDYLSVNGRKRLFQGDYGSAQHVAIGAKLAGAEVRTFWCNQAGDITSEPWDTPQENAPWREEAYVIDSRLATP